MPARGAQQSDSQQAIHSASCLFAISKPPGQRLPAPCTGEATNGGPDPGPSSGGSGKSLLARVSAPVQSAKDKLLGTSSSKAAPVPTSVKVPPATLIAHDPWSFHTPPDRGPCMYWPICASGSCCALALQHCRWAGQQTR